HIEDGVLDVDEHAEIIPFDYSITAYGADFTVDGLVKRLHDSNVVVPMFSLPAAGDAEPIRFQRELVWKKFQADRFIESLLLGLPVPGIFLVKEPNGTFLVLDGQQRLRTLESFYTGIFQGTEFRLDNVQEQWVGKSYRTLRPDDRRRLDNSILHAT